MGELPLNWTRVPLEFALTDIVGGGTPSKSVPEYFQGSIPLMTVKDMKTRRPHETGFNITEEALAASSARLVPEDTIIIATRMGLGKVVRPLMATAINQDLKALFPSDVLDKTFLEQWLISIASKIEAMGTGTTVKGVRLNQIKGLELSLPPLNEQRRIVEKIEALFAELDKGEEALRKVQALLKRYRQSVLKAAVTGELTAEWRAENADTLDHGGDLLARILETRRENWTGRGKYKEPVAPDTTGLPDLPDGWVWATVEQIAGVSGGLTKNRKRQEMLLKAPMLRVANVYQNRLELSEVHQIGLTEVESVRAAIALNDLLVVEGNGSKDQIGRMAIWRCEVPNAVHQNHLIKVRLCETDLVEFALYWFQSPLGRQYVETVASSTSGLYTLSISKVEALVLPIPALSEADEIVCRIEAAFSRSSSIERWCETELARSAALRQSILKEAFAGRLVPQDPDDEPASELLARIRAERAAEPKKTARKAQSAN